MDLWGKTPDKRHACYRTTIWGVKWQYFLTCLPPCELFHRPHVTPCLLPWAKASIQCRDERPGRHTGWCRLLPASLGPWLLLSLKLQGKFCMDEISDAWESDPACVSRDHWRWPSCRPRRLFLSVPLLTTSDFVSQQHWLQIVSPIWGPMWQLNPFKIVFFCPFITSVI